MKYIFLVLLLIGCTKQQNGSQVTLGLCYRYPNSEQQDVHMKVIKTYDKGGFMAEFIVNKHIFTDIHEFEADFRHLKEIDCAMFYDLKSMVRPNE